MQKLFKQREEFNDAMGITSNIKFGTITQKEWELERDMLLEEIDEYETACKEGNVVEIADALGDVLYLVIGAMFKHGMAREVMEEIMDEIQRSNMSKCDPVTGKAIYSSAGKVLKPGSYSKPNIKGILEKYLLV